MIDAPPAVEDRCIACGCTCEDRGVWTCETCERGPFCRYCLVLRHAPKHGRGVSVSAVTTALAVLVVVAIVLVWWWSR